MHLRVMIFLYVLFHNLIHHLGLNIEYLVYFYISIFRLSRSFDECCESRWRLRSTFRWNRFSQIPHANGLYPLCFLIWVIKLDDWLKTFPHTTHLWGFSPRIKNRIFTLARLLLMVQYKLSIAELQIKFKVTCVNICMFLHVWLLMKSFSTILTRIRSGIRMYQ